MPTIDTTGILTMIFYLRLNVKAIIKNPRVYKPGTNETEQVGDF